MVMIYLVELNENEAVYEYLPEGKKSKGKIAFNRKKKERSVIQKAEGYSSSYAFHALRRIEEYDSEDDFKKEDMVAWY